MKKLILTICLIGTLLSQGCGTIMSGTTQDVWVSSNPQGIVVTAENGQSIITPGAITLKRKTEHTLTAKFYKGKTAGMSDVIQQSKIIKQHMNWGWFFSNIIWDFGIISMPIDLISGGAYVLSPPSVHFTLKEENKLQ